MCSAGFRQLGDAVCAGGRHPGRMLHRAAHRLQVWIEFEQGDPDYPIWTGGFWGTGGGGARSSPLAPPADPAGAEHRAADDRPEHGVGQRCAADAGRPAESC